jgi:hypothetical protein
VFRRPLVAVGILVCLGAPLPHSDQSAGSGDGKNLASERQLVFKVKGLT